MSGATASLSPALAARVASCTIVCPGCRSGLSIEHEATPHCAPGLTCSACGEHYGIRGGMPLLVPRASAFHGSLGDTAAGSYFSTHRESRLKRRLRRALPALGRDMGDGDARLRRALGDLAGAPHHGLAIGAGERPGAYRERFPGADWLVTDIDAAYGPELLADALHLPVADGSMDLVVAEMVLEHVLDPGRAAREIERVVRPGGLVFITTPFIFPWHGIPIDFQRFTPSGLVALFRGIEPRWLGPGMGRWSALAYQLDAALVSCAGSRPVRRALAALGRFAFGWIKWLDRAEHGSATSRAASRRLIAAGGLILIGSRSATPRSDAETVDLLRRRFGDGP